MNSNPTVKNLILKYGGYAAVARAFGVNRVSVFSWAARGVVPASRVEKFCRLTGCKPGEANPAFSRFSIRGGKK